MNFRYVGEPAFSIEIEEGDQQNSDDELKHPKNIFNNKKSNIRLYSIQIKGLTFCFHSLDQLCSNSFPTFFLNYLSSLSF